MSGFIIMLIAAVVFGLLAAGFAGIWVYRDAKQRGIAPGIWVLVVVLGGIFMGLILYLLFGRKQKSSVGDEKDTAGGNGFIAASIICVILCFMSIGASLYFYFTADGFLLEKKYSFYTSNLTDSAKSVMQSSLDDVWEFAFEEATGGYTLAKTYNAPSEPVALSVEIQCSGSVQLIIAQDGAVLSETVTEGSYSYDMSDFRAGKINMKIINIDAGNLAGKIVVENSN